MKKTIDISDFIEDQVRNPKVDVEKFEYYAIVMSVKDMNGAVDVGFLADVYVDETGVPELTDSTETAIDFRTVSDAMKTGERIYNIFRTVEGWCLYHIVCETKTEVRAYTLVDEQGLTG